MVDQTQKRRNAETQKADCRQSTILQRLESVTDPEIPVLSIVDMGMVAAVRMTDEGVEVDLTPTFVGCPAIDVIRENIRAALAAAGEPSVTVNIVFDPPWTSDRITPAGREKLRQFGLAPPGSPSCGAEFAEPRAVPCPFCGSTNTDLESLFGPTLCRSIHYCRACLQSFEHFKPI